MDGESDADTREGTFGAGTFWTKTKILFGGVMMNWLVSFVLFTILAWIGMPIVLDNQYSVDIDKTTVHSVVTVTKVEENSPAERAGIKPGDKILKIGDEEVYTSLDVANENILLGEYATLDEALQAKNKIVEWIDNEAYAKVDLSEKAGDAD